MTVEKTESNNSIQYMDNSTFDSDTRTSLEHENGGSDPSINRNNLINEFLQIRKRTLELFKPLRVEDT